jgi:hypothetical protein
VSPPAEPTKNDERNLVIFCCGELFAVTSAAASIIAMAFVSAFAFFAAFTGFSAFALTVATASAFFVVAHIFFAS